MTSPQARADSVRSAVSSASTCTPATVTLLSDLLSQSVKGQGIDSATAIKAASKRSSRTQSRTAQPPKPRTSVENPSKDGKFSESDLSPKEKATLATEIINSTLKVLSNPTKESRPVRRQPSSTDVKEGSLRKALRRSNSLPQSPIQPRSLKRVSSSPSIESRSVRSSSSASIAPSYYRATAECSRLAFACMRTLQNTNTPCLMNMLPLQLETGMSALVGRLIAIGLDDLALKELRILKRRLETTLNPSNKQLLRARGKTDSMQTSNTTGGNQTLADMLEFEVIPPGNAVLALATTVQLHALKLIASSKKPSFIVAALPKLDTESTGSPTQLLLRSAKESQNQTTKAVRQLEALSQLLLSLCPNISTSEDANVIASKTSVPPEAAFDLQTIALQNRLLCWKFSGHQGDVEVNVLGPFSRCLAAFARRSQANIRDIYKNSRQAFERIQSVIPTCSSGIEKSTKSSISNIYKVLGSLAQDAGDFREAIRWLKTFQEGYNTAPFSDVQLCTIAANLATLKLLVSATDVEVEELLMKVLDGLDGPLKGESSELDELLSAASKLRRAAISVLYKRDPGSTCNTTKTVSDGIRQMCESLILLCPRFSNRYLGKRPDHNSATKTILRHEQRRQLLVKSGFHAIDSAIFLIKAFQSEKRLTWDLMDSTLQDCLRLLEGIGDVPSELADESTSATTSYFVRISHLYFTQHLNMRRDAQDPKNVQYIRPLRRSIDCISSRSASEKKSAIVNSKLERLADIFKLAGRNDEARVALVCLRNELVESGALSIVGKAGQIMPMQAAWDENEATSMLARSISSLLKLELKSGLKFLQPPLYETSWAIQERGMVLELLLDIIHAQPGFPQSTQRNVVLELLKVYDPQNFPVRRLRVIAQLLRLDRDQRRDLVDEVKNALAIASLRAVIEQSEDHGLLPYLPHLQALASSALEIQEDHPRVDLLKPHLASWCLILETCKDLETLSRVVDDVSELLSHLSSIADFLQMRGYGKMRIGVLRMIANLNEIPRPNSSPDDLVLSYISLGLQYLELGYSGKAGLALDRAQSYSSNNGVTPEAMLRMHLSYGEYSLFIGNSERCEESLLRAQTLALQNPDVSIVSKSSGTLPRRIVLASLAADAFLLHSIVALAQGTPDTALAYAKRSVKLARYSWLRATTSVQFKSEKIQDGFIEGGVDDLLNMVVLIDTHSVANTTLAQLPGPAAWSLLNPLFRGLLQLSKIYAYYGMFQETLYYNEQAHNLVELVDSGACIATALASAGYTWLTAGKLDKASELLLKAKELMLPSTESPNSVQLSCYLGRLHRLLDNHEAELAAYETANTILDTLSSVKHIAEIDHINDTTAILEEEMSRLTLTQKTRNAKEPRKTSWGKKQTTKKNNPPPKLLAEAHPPISEECRGLSSLKGLLLREKCGALMLLKQYDDALAAVKEAEAHAPNQADSMDQHLVIAKQLLLQSIGGMSSDPVYSVLQDSTLSFPAVVSSHKGVVFSAEKLTGTRHTPPKKATATLSARNRYQSKSPSSVGFFDMLRQAQEHLIEAYYTAFLIASTPVVHSLTSLLSAVTILLSGAGLTSGKAFLHPSLVACSLEISRNIAFQRKRKAVIGEVGNSSEESSGFQWPTLLNEGSRQSTNGLTSDVLQFQKDYVDVIPAGWTAISISLSANRQEICLSKMQTGQSPFVLRLPLGRNNSRDIDEEVFDFAQGRAELSEIIELANSSSHSAKDLTGREAKSAWWAEREALDERLKDLLVNIENVWLGGFKGIFSQHRPRPDLLARFQKSFQNILDKHLPSRQTTGKKGKGVRVMLDTRILELFTGLESNTTEDCDIDEALTDLLYFVVDVLQFHGERNAYDEIDFDSIVIETQDALRSYHQAALATSSGDEDQHTILILDKALHAFPWESLPCMDGMAVSRLPSLGCLRDLVLEQQNIASIQSGNHCVNRASGSYILNPGGDLKNTQAAFEGNLKSLSGWNGIIKREPSESEMTESLEEKDIFLYFGHGSGAQYIRSKAIKRLSKCAVTILMGCSSGALSEAGEFEPYGPPIDYMLAGCPALVATLWDVTDKDIDRFAKSAFEHWGLFKPQLGGIEQPKKGKGKKTIVEEMTSKDKLSLVEAVAEGRKACNFRYLTAAAVCVYGIPVYLE